MAHGVLSRIAEKLRGLSHPMCSSDPSPLGEWDKFQSYQAQFPFPTVVPEPPRTIVQKLICFLLRLRSFALYVLLFVVPFPLWFLLHLFFHLLERRQRGIWLQFHLDWPHRSVPHERELAYPENGEFPLENWHLRCEDGRQRWFYGSALGESEQGNELSKAVLKGYDSVEAANKCHHQSRLSKEEQESMREKMWERRRFLERYQMCLDQVDTTSRRATSEEAMRDGVEFLLRLQDPFSGHWPNDYSGCMFLTPGMIIVKYIMAQGKLEKMFSDPIPGHQHIDGNGEKETCVCALATRSELIRYLRNYQNSDGGFGQHTEGHSTMIGSVLSYISLRLLDVPPTDGAMERCRAWIRREGGAVWTPAWGKVWLSILNVYSWEGVDPIPPELIFLPDWVPFSLGRTWCHSRVIAIPFSYFYGQRWAAPLFPVTKALREELYLDAYDSIPWRQYRGACCGKDLYTPVSSMYRVAMRAMAGFEAVCPRWLRRRALEENWRHMAYDDENTNFICLGPVNKSLNMLATWDREGAGSARLRMHEERVWDYLYMNRAGMKMSGYNGSQLWDTSFAVQAICACGLQDEYAEAMRFAHHYVDIAQVQEDPMAAEQFYRHRTKGAWNFSTSNQGWQVSDCTAEGLRVLLLLPQYPFPMRRLFDGVDEILSLRNIDGDGGWPSYEPTRAPSYAELMNCAELFKDVMLEYSYAECSSSCIHTLSLFRQQYPHYRTNDVNQAIREGIACVLEKQRPDGAIYGSWAVCFTYAAWITSSALAISGELPEMEAHPNCIRLINFLLAHQREDGGWGEDINSCVREEWTDSPDGSQVVNTAWAVMAIMNASGRSGPTPFARRKVIKEAVDRGVELILSRQLTTGDWRQERISGVFNGNNPIHYPGYKNCMTVWALGKYHQWKDKYVVTK